MNICIHISSDEEWNSVKNIFTVPASHLKQQAFGEYFEQEINDKKCIIYYSGPSKTKASAACQHAIDKWTPEIIYVLGTCGAVSETLNIFDIVMANRTIQYDCQEFIGENTNTFYSPMITDINISHVNIDNIKDEIKLGIIGTADRDIDFEGANCLRKENILAADWESGAISKICDINDVKCIIFRGVSDKPTENSSSDKEKQINDYRKNTAIVMDKLFNLLKKII
ncbi:MAG TPA: 5'-methylthioadenosine/S-adenosylhomocysteine nucleosidase [Victivallales bacterium]|nr:5'-methylthioadenosine/S-adenosylhomocysteine nucleosidase [Victivallales bacterium]